jgi:hypothetical protein
VQPFRLPQWPKGQYLATAMFFAQDEPQGWVKCELIQTLDVRHDDVITLTLTYYAPFFRLSRSCFFFLHCVGIK